MIKGTLKIVPVGEHGDLLMLPRAEQSKRLDFNICDKHLLDRRVNLFIASQKWETLELHMQESMNFSVIPLIANKCNKVNITFLSEVGDNMLQALCELYPDKIGTLRRSYMLKKDIRAIVGSWNNE